MKAKLQRLEIEGAVAGNDDLAVEHATRWQLCHQRRNQFRVVAGERLLVTTLDVDVISILEDEGAEPVPLRFEDPVAAFRQGAHPEGEHRRDRLDDGRHAGTLTPRRRRSTRSV